MLVFKVYRDEDCSIDDHAVKAGRSRGHTALSYKYGAAGWTYECDDCGAIIKVRTGRVGDTMPVDQVTIDRDRTCSGKSPLGRLNAILGLRAA